MFSFGTILTYTGLIRTFPSAGVRARLTLSRLAFTVDLYLPQAASALAAQVATRAIAACAFPLFSTQVRSTSIHYLCVTSPVFPTDVSRNGSPRRLGASWWGYRPADTYAFRIRSYVAELRRKTLADSVFRLRSAPVGSSTVTAAFSSSSSAKGARTPHTSCILAAYNQALASILRNVSNSTALLRSPTVWKTELELVLLLMLADDD